ncbi:hypothetical protein KIPB_002341 [Kipferlia bialata]|uniref:Uncharacterized protein n=1 Tax=Kipferlia bialata TaxID=797122 RepID=A0A9K3CQL8_9EUKA|nr:hypothetical protein KIPB_002341 [Kipferlia bialata]|eukprot:g2341.t1
MQYGIERNTPISSNSADVMDVSLLEYNPRGGLTHTVMRGTGALHRQIRTRATLFYAVTGEASEYAAPYTVLCSSTHSGKTMLAGCLAQETKLTLGASTDHPVTVVECKDCCGSLLAAMRASWNTTRTSTLPLPPLPHAYQSRSAEALGCQWVARAAWSKASFKQLVFPFSDNVRGRALCYLHHLVEVHMKEFTQRGVLTYEPAQAALLHLLPGVITGHSPAFAHLISHGFMDTVVLAPSVDVGLTPAEQQRAFTAGNTSTIYRSPADASISYALIYKYGLGIVRQQIPSDVTTSSQSGGRLGENRLAVLMNVASACDLNLGLPSVTYTVRCSLLSAMPLTVYLHRLARVSTCSWMGEGLVHPGVEGYVCPLVSVIDPAYREDDEEELTLAEARERARQMLQKCYCSRSLLLRHSRYSASCGMFSVMIPRNCWVYCASDCHTREQSDPNEYNDIRPFLQEASWIEPADVHFGVHGMGQGVWHPEDYIRRGYGIHAEGEGEEDIGPPEAAFCTILMVHARDTVAAEMGEREGADTWLRNHIEALYSGRDDMGERLVNPHNLAVFVFDGSSTVFPTRPDFELGALDPF